MLHPTWMQMGVFMRVLVSALCSRFMRYPVPCNRDWADKWSFNKLRVTLGVIFSAHKSFCLRFMRLFSAAAAACDNLSCLARFLFAR